MTTFTSKIKNAQYSITRWLGRAVTYGILGAWTLFGLYAMGWIVLSSLSDTKSIFSNKLLDYIFTHGPLFANYVKALSTHQMGRYFINSTIYVLASLFIIVIIAAPASYVLSRFEFRGRKFFHNMFVAGMGIPGTLVMIPLFSMFLRLKLTGTLAGLITVYVCTSIPFTVYFLTGFFSSLPTELDDAARIDGCTDMGVFWRIMLPLAQPGLITVVVFNFIGLWNDYFWALIFANDAKRRTLALGLESLVQSMRYTGDWGGLFASIMIVFLPTFLLYIFLSEKIIAGVTAGAVKS